MSRLPVIRPFAEGEAEEVGVLIADTFGAYNLSVMTPGVRQIMLGPFAFARSALPEHREAVATAIVAPVVLVADQGGDIVGVLRGGRIDHKGRTVLSSLFVSGRHHRQGIGRALVERFEEGHTGRRPVVLKLASTLHAVAFYWRLGYWRSTGVRFMPVFGESGLPYQPMKKIIRTV